jgi:divalent metal cation (Fe/Co/Zn/Cd) transporter
MKSNPESAPVQPREITSFGVLGARLTWVIAGPLAALAIALGIVTSGGGWLTGLDAAFGVVVGLMLLGRWVEHRSGAATAVTGEPATPEQFKRYMTLMPLLAAAVWIVANVVGNYVVR